MSAPLPFFLTFLHLTRLSRSVQRSPSLPFLRKRRASTQEDDIDDIFSPFLYYFCPPIKREYPPFPFSRDIASCFDRDVRGREREEEEKISVTVSNLRERGETISPITFTIDGVEMNIYQARREYPGDEARKGGNFDAFCVIGCAFHSRSPISRDLLCLYAVIFVERYEGGREYFSKYHRNIVLRLPSCRDKSGNEKSVD